MKIYLQLLFEGGIREGIKVKLIVNADDFGLSRGVNYAIADAHELGIVTSTTMLTNMPDAGHAFKIMSNYPHLRVGTHLTLSCGKPIGSGYQTLTNENGYFKLTNQYLEVDKNELNLDEVEQEWRLQIQEFYKRGLEPSHIDSHHHIHTWEPLIPVIEKLSNEFTLPCRGGFKKTPKSLQLYSDIFDAGFYGDGVSEEYFNKLFAYYGDSNYSVEVMCHPAYIDGQLTTLSSYLSKRVEEFTVLTNVTIPNKITLI